MRIGIYKPEHKTKWLEDKQNTILLQISEGDEYLNKNPTETIVKIFKSDIDLNKVDQTLYNLDINPSHGPTLQIRKHIIKVQIYCFIDKFNKDYYLSTKHTIKDLIKYIEAS